MKNEENWQESKFIKNRKGHWTYSPNIVSSRLIVKCIAQLYETYIPQHVKGNLLDLGCGNVPLYGMYKSYAKSVYCVDWENSLHNLIHLDKTCDLNKPLDLPANTFDTIILSDVLEHIAQPQKLFAEMNRLLCEEGKILLNVPFLYWIHEAPHDYYRFTEYALLKFAEEQNFRVLEMIPFGSAAMVIADIISKNLVRIPVLGTLLAKITQSVAILAKPRVYKHTMFPLGYFLILQK